MIRTPSIQKPRAYHSHRKSSNLLGRSGGGGARPSPDDSGRTSFTLDFRSVDTFLLGLRVIWCCIILYGEVWTFSNAAKGCRWPSNFGYELTSTGSKPFKLLVISDPQLLDMRSYPSKNILYRFAAMSFTDHFARRSWRMILKNHKPDAVFFLGDLLDSGVEVTDRDEHSHYVHRFQNIFPKHPRDLPMYYIPGNHDLGLHMTRGGSAYARERFTETFGPLNGEVELGNHTLIWIDTPGLLEERALVGDETALAAPDFVPAAGGVMEFLQHFRDDVHSLPTILFSHIPLYRPEGTPCGPLRESKQTLRQGMGKNYQNEVDSAASKYLLDITNPSLIFSGDDHDYCDITHHLAMSSPHEVTCKTFSSVMEVQKPGYQLVSLLNPLRTRPVSMSLSPTHLHQLCLLPNQTGIYTHFYLPFLLITLAVLAIPRVYENLITRKGTSARSNGLAPSSSPSLLRFLRRSQVKPADEEEDFDDNASISSGDGDEDYQDINNSFSYPISPLHNHYSYHSPTDDDYTNIVSPREIVPRQGKSRVRRVSRVWLWDPKEADEGYFKSLKKLGPVYRYLIRPMERTLRKVFHKLYGRRLQQIVAKLNSGNVLGETLREFGSIVVWTIIPTYLLIWFWFSWW